MTYTPITQAAFEEFLKTCTVDYDEQDYDDNIGYLCDDQGERIASVNFDSGKHDTPKDVFINDSDCILLTCQQQDQIIERIYVESDTDARDENKKDAEDYQRDPYAYNGVSRSDFF